MPTLEKIKTEIDKEESAAKEARATLVKLRESAEKEGVTFDPEKDSDAFEKIDDAYKVYDTHVQKAATYRARYEKELDIEGALAGDRPDPAGNGNKAGAAEVKVPRTMADLAVKRFRDHPEVKAAEASWRSGNFQRTGEIEVWTRDEFAAMVQSKATPQTKTAGDNVLTGLSDTSAGAFVWPEQSPLFVDIPFRPLRVRERVTVTTTDSDAVEYVEETTQTNNAAETLEATSGSTGTLAESAEAFAVRSVITQNIGHYIPATTRSLADYGGLNDLLSNRLTQGVLVRLDSQMLNGNGSTPNLEGIYQATTQSQALGGDSRSDAVHKAMTVIRVAATINDAIEPDTLFIHPNDEQDLRLEKDANGNYIFGGPTAPRNFPVWGLQLVPSLSATSGTPVLGDAKQAYLWVREGVTVSVTDSNASWFLNNILTFKAQMRVAFKTTRAAAFCEITSF